MRLHKKVLMLLATIAFLVGTTSAALAIEAFQERWEWGDMSKPTKIIARVIVVDPYDKAVWLSAAIFGGNAESGLWWQKMQPGRTIKFYAKDNNVWNKLKGLGRTGVGPAAARSVPPGSKTTVVQVVATEPQQNRRVIHSVKVLPEVAGSPAVETSIAALLAGCKGKDSSAKCRKATTKVASAPKATPRQRYDVMLPGGRPIAGFIPNANAWNMK